MEILLRVGRSSTNDEPSQSPLESTRRRQVEYNPFNWVNTRVQDEGDTCPFVGLLQGLRTVTPVHSMVAGRICVKEVELNSALSPDMRVP